MRVLFIAPYKGLAQLVESLRLDLQGYQVTTYIANLEESANYIRSKNYSDSDFDIIISRGGTAKTLRENTSLQVVEVDVSGYDILRLITYLKNFDDKIGVVGFNNIISNFKSVSMLIDIDLHFKSINDEKNVKTVLKELKNSNINVVVGDTVTVDIATEMGMEGILLTSGKESIYDSFNKADILYSETEKYKNEIDILKNMNDYIEMPIILLDNKYKVKYKNRNFNKLISTSSFDFVLNNYRKLNDINENLLLHNNITLMLSQSIFEKDYIIKIKKFSDNYMNVITRLEYTKEPDQIMNTKIRIWDMNFNEIENLGLTSDDVIEKDKICKFLKYNYLTLIGESGNGRELVIQRIFKEKSNLRHIIEIKLEKLDTMTFNNILKFIESISNDTLILIKDAHILSHSQQQKILKLFERIKVLVVFLYNSEKLLANIKLNKMLWKVINGNKLIVKNLNEKESTISKMIITYLKHLNVKYGKQIVGIKNNDFSLFEEYSWPGHLPEFKSTIDRLYLDSTNEFLLDITTLPYNCNQNVGYNNPNLKLIDLSRSLSEIEREIIEKVFEEENFNKTNTARRLSINRSTLWRKINNET